VKAKTDRSHGPRLGELRLGKPPRDHHEKDSRKAGAVLAPNQNIENNPMQSSMCRCHGCFTRENILTRRANQGHYSTIAQFVKRPWPCPTTGASARLQAKNLPDN
jgi:hypothetical protein